MRSDFSTAEQQSSMRVVLVVQMILLYIIYGFTELLLYFAHRTYTVYIIQ